MSADRVAAEWPRRRGKMRERAEAGSSRPVIFKHVKSDTVTVEMFFSPLCHEIGEEKLLAAILIGA